jgi:type II secretory pathway pseudopilin PulG
MVLKAATLPTRAETEMPTNKPQRAPAALTRRAFSLPELIITTLLVGIIVIGIVPLFTRAISNNIYGADASQLASFLRSGAERVQQRSANAQAFTTEGTTVTLYDSGPRAGLNNGDAKLGDERWVPELIDGDPTEPQGMFLWVQTRTVTGYSVADVFRGNIKVGGNALVPLGDPKLFDNPGVFYGKPDVSEIRMVVESMKGGRDNPEAASTPSGIKQKATVGQYRAF